MRWLHHLGAPNVVRINSKGAHLTHPQLYMDERSFVLTVNGCRVDADDLQAVWYRKGGFWFEELFQSIDIPGHSALSRALNNKNKSEDFRIREYFHHLIQKKARVLGNPRRSELNKLITLDHARNVGFLIPPFFVSNQRAMFEKKLSHGAFITKPVSDGIYLWDLDEAQRGYFSFTETLSVEMLTGYDERMPPSFAQEQIDKDIEIRVFYLDGQTYPMAIFSQNDQQTKTDYRKYNYDRPNRNVPYSLPDDVIAKLKRLFEKLELNTGSADFMVDKFGNYYFLEINPTGQFSALSQSCNYDIEHAVASWLMVPRHGQ